MRRDDFYPFFSRLLTVSVHEGNFMDPQVRMLLSCIWEAFEQGRPVPGPAGR
jgi:acyl transferase domain-containing protein